ncbi:hypothetical protein FRC08_016045 [Ceratobasidium sp. 394]|nr:hypothetical protein FRC08_016045 [Ceratobasidium sp. 394]
MPPKSESQVSAKPIAHLPPREQIANRANAKRVEKGLPTFPTLASLRTRRSGTDKTYYPDKAPDDVPRCKPNKQTTVARLPGQEDIPRSPTDILSALKEAARLSSSQSSTNNSGLLAESATTEATSSGTQQDSHPFDGPDDSAPEPQHQPVANLSTEDAHLLDLPDSQSNSDFYPANNWGHVDGGLNDLNGDEGAFNNGGGFDANTGFSGLNGGGGFNNWTFNQGLQSEFAMPQSHAFPNTHTQFPFTMSSALPNGYSGFAQTVQTHTSGSTQMLHPTNLSTFPATTPLAGQSNSQPPSTATAALNVPWSTTLPPPAPYTNTSPANGSHDVPSHAGETMRAHPPATTLMNHGFHNQPMSTPVRNSSTGPHAHLRRVNDSSKKISSKTPQRKYMKAKVVAHYAVKRARQQRNSRSRSHRQTPQAIEASETEPVQSGSTTQTDGAVAPAIALTQDDLTADQLAVGLPMRKYIGFHILTRLAWPMDQSTLLTSALGYA